MKALVLNAIGRRFELEEVNIALPIGREVLVRVQASGLCHTDMLFATNEIAPTPSVLGHEVAGIVEAVGPAVAQFRVGEHVVGSLTQSCGACARCLSARSFQCQRPEATLRRPADVPRLSREGTPLFQGFGLGGFAEQASVELLKDIAQRWANRRKLDIAEKRLEGMTKAQAEATLPAITFDAIDVSFDAITDPEERRYFMNLPTSFVLPDEAVDRLRAVGGRLLRESRSYQNLLKQIAEGSAAQAPR